MLRHFFDDYIVWIIDSESIRKAKSKRKEESEKKTLLENIKYKSVQSTKVGEGVLGVNGKLFSAADTG